uniref:C2H2-type domain-containing protein n=1 Tax=Panagrolaimus davidi TaxID=227884 RepID=A0A914QQW0_9BILA
MFADDFILHLSQIHSFGKIAIDYYYPTFVQPNQIDIDSSNLRLNSSYPLTFTKKDDEYLWCCHLCGKVFRDSEIGYLFAKIGAHILTKKLSYKNISKSYALLTQCASFSQMQIYYETLQWNSLQYQRVFNSISAVDETIKRRCPFCSKNYFLPKLLNDDSAEILHILVDHDGIGNDSLLLRYIIGSPSVGDNFPFLDVLFGDTLDRKASERRLRCKKCLTVFKNYHELLIHGRIHVSNHQIDPARYFFALPAESINILLSKLIDGVSTYDKFPKYDYTIYICTTCLQIMNPNGCSNFARMIEHIKSCQYNEPSISIDELPMAFKETKFRIWTFPPSLCSICEKQYVTAFAAKQCCTTGQPLSIFTKKRSIATKSATEPAEKRKVDIVDFVFKTF